jgi:hypothetical protein
MKTKIHFNEVDTFANVTQLTAFESPHRFDVCTYIDVRTRNIPTCIHCIAKRRYEWTHMQSFFMCN